MKLRAWKLLRYSVLAAFVCMVAAGSAWAQGTRAGDDAEFGPVVRTYLGYLRSEQEVVDDRASRHEVSPAYYRRNSNRIRALRQMALRIARETRNDFVPELYAVTNDELGTLFDPPPQPPTFRVGEVIENTFRYLGAVRASESFHLFARLDVYEQAELAREREAQQPPAAAPAATSAAAASAVEAPAGTTPDAAPRGNRPATTRPRRVHIP